MAAAGSGPMAWGGVSAGGPGPELAGVEYCPDAGDPAGCDLERVHRHGDAVLLGHQARLAVDRALQEPHVAGCYAGEIGQVARDPLAAFDRPGAAGTRPPPSPVRVAPRSSRPMRAPMSPASQAFLKSLTMLACRLAGSREPVRRGCGGGPPTPAGGRPPGSGLRCRRLRRRSSRRHHAG